MSDLANETDATGAAASDVSDVALLAELAAGSKAAFSRLYDRHSRIVYAYAAARLTTRDDVEEISQDVFVTLWRKRSALSIAGESALPWLLVTCRNLILNRRRANQSAARRRTDAPVDDTLADTAPGPDAMTERAQLLALVEAAAARLPEPDRTIFELCIRGYASYEEAAVAAGISAGAVRNRLSRLRTRLRSELQTLRGTDD
ncbi:DNA-directed RNA polymerase sigma-70 factor [Leifsonia sp. LS1]|uniref:RNA polymerase sigma factor n=1 Tax=Leifsonia sp. LS1 TaxID=2828483 RepID=UPI001CFD2575|nr:RNA polymerase sigma factor [Leifsonia sp. LS1]GIT79630.1 DNA-directed RNA polymerase sigma-70 factor [Leifsonia sp. LS1]